MAVKQRLQQLATDTASAFMQQARPDEMIFRTGISAFDTCHSCIS